MQSVEKDWPLYIVDNDGGQNAIILKPGEMLLYESARLVHGRPRPLQGDFYDNLMVAFR